MGGGICLFWKIVKDWQYLIFQIFKMKERKRERISKGTERANKSIERNYLRKLEPLLSRLTELVM